MQRYLLPLPLLFVACSPLTHEPRNLSDLKAEVREYAENGTYEKDLAASVSNSKAYLTARAAKGGGNLTVIFDIDETVLSNLPHMKEADWGYQPKHWDKWVAEADAPALPPVRDVYHHAISLGMKVVFLTGRTEADRTATARNLREQGMGSSSYAQGKAPVPTLMQSFSKQTSAKNSLNKATPSLPASGIRKATSKAAMSKRASSSPTPSTKSTSCCVPQQAVPAPSRCEPPLLP
jgi:hypothetical protein